MENDNNKVIKFNDNDEISHILNVLNDEFLKEMTTNQNSDIYLKNLSKENKCKVFSDVLQSKITTNPYILSNVVFLIRNYNSLSDEFFKSDLVIFSDIAEFLDIKLAISDDIHDFINELTKWYFSIFISAHKVDKNFLDNADVMPQTIRSMLTTLDMFTLSGICSNADMKKIDSLYLVNDAYDLMAELTLKNNIVNDEFKKLAEFAANNNTKDK